MLVLGRLTEPVRSQTVTPRHYLVDVWPGGESGLVQNTITGIAQTPDGYLWVSTLDGVARFDGLQFKMFKAADTPAMGSGRIRFLFPGRAGRLWLCTQEGGVTRLENSKFSPALVSGTPGIRMPSIQAAEEPSGALWLSDEAGGVRCLKEGHLSMVSTNWAAIAGSPLQVTIDQQDRLWAVGAAGLYRVVNGQLVKALERKGGPYVVHCQSRAGGWWLSSEGQVRLWRDGEWLASAPAPPSLPRSLKASIEDHHGHLWLGTPSDGLFRYDTNATVLQFTRKDGLSSDSVRVLFEDSEGSLWVGTEGGGLSRLRRPLFDKYGPSQGLPAELVTSVSESPERELWIGTYGNGLKRLPAHGEQMAVNAPATASFHILAALADRRGRVWLGTGTGGAFCWEQGHLTRLGAFPTNGPVVRCIYEDSQGALWFGRHSTNTLVRIQDGRASFLELPKSLGLVDVRALCEDASGNLWIGTDGAGLLRWKGGQFTRFTREQGLSSDYIWALHADPEWGLWIGTYGGGLARLKDGRVAVCTTRHGLVDDVICAILDDGRGQYWFSSHQGVFRASREELNRFADGAMPRIQCVAYGRSDGLPVLECKGGFQPASCRTHDGRLWFPTIRGLVVVDPADVSTNAVAPLVHIEEVVVDAKVMGPAQWRTEARAPLAPGRESRSSRLEIPAGSRRFEIHYTGLSYGTPEKLRFRHRMEGVDADWVETGAQRMASYHRLPHGTYTFQVQACNREGKWSPQSASLTLVLLPAFWQTWWFQGVFLATFGGAIGWGVGYTLLWRHRRHLLLLERLNRLERERVRVARDLHDDLGASLTAMGFLGERAARDSHTLPEAQKQLLAMADRTRELGQKLDQTVWAVNPKNDSSRHLTSYLCRFAEEFLEPRSIQPRLQLAAEIPDVELTTETRHNILLVVKEAINNAAKHAQATEVMLRVAAQNEVLIIEVSDNGRGFVADAVAGTGNGLRNMATRMAEVGGQLEVRSSPRHGTTVCLRLPLPKGRLAASVSPPPT